MNRKFENDFITGMHKVTREQREKEEFERNSFAQELFPQCEATE